jgi:hypothetical protein
MPPPARPSRRFQLITQVVTVVGVIGVLGLTLDAALLLANYRLGQSALDNAAAAAAGAVDARIENDITVLELRTEDGEGGRSAYTLAQEQVDLYGGGRVYIQQVLFDGSRVLVQGGVTAPVLFARLAGITEIDLPLLASVEVVTRP